MNTRLKGSKLRLYAKKQLEILGYTVDICEKTQRWVKERDLFGVADLCCIRNNHVLFVQVTSNRPHTHQRFKDFARRYAGNNLWIEQWVHVDRKGFKMYRYDMFGNVIIYSEGEVDKYGKEQEVKTR